MFGIGRQKQFVMTAGENDYQRIAELHNLSFDDGWAEAEITRLALEPTVTLLVTRPVGQPDGEISGFNLIRQTRDEAEILSIAIDPKRRRAGLADTLMREAILRLSGDRVAALFLEVDSTNLAAVNLYSKLGFETVGTRPGYYKKPPASPPPIAHSNPATALVMRLNLA